MSLAHAASPPKVRVEFTEIMLENGLRVQLVEDHSAPVIALNVAYDVGSRNERKGLTGFAHLFEHMMFKGSQNVGDGEHFYQVFSNGGSMNGTTNADLTLYFETLPANQLELALFLEADRMRSLEITQEKLDNQRHAVQEERRLRIDNQPYGRADERFSEVFYDNFAYKHSTIGSMEDLNAASIEDVAQFFRTYYAPNNAVLSLVGDFSKEEAVRLIRKYFEGVPRQPEPAPIDLKEPPQRAERRETLTDPLARLAQVQVGYKTAPGSRPDQYALQVLSSVLQGGDSSRLYQSLSKEKELVAGVGGYVDERIGVGGLYIGATIRPGRKTRMWRPRSTRRSNGLRSSRLRVGARESEERNAFRLPAEHPQRADARDFARHVYREVRRSESHQHTAGQHQRGDARGRAARRKAISPPGKPYSAGHSPAPAPPAAAPDA